MVGGNVSPSAVLAICSDASQLLRLLELMQKAGLHAATFENIELALLSEKASMSPTIVLASMEGIISGRIRQLLRSQKGALLNRVPRIVVLPSLPFGHYEWQEGELDAEAIFPWPGDESRFIEEMQAVAAGARKRTSIRTLLAEEMVRVRTHELLESKERYRRILEAVSDYIYTVKIVDGKVANTKHGPGCLAVTGYHEYEFDRDRSLWLNMILPADRNGVIDLARRAAAGDSIEPIEHQIMRKDGELRWVSNTIVLHRDEHGILDHYDGLIHDVTERKRAEASIEAGESKYQTLFREMLNGFALHEMIYDDQGRPKDYRFLAVNPAFERMTGLKANAIVGKTVREVLPNIESFWIETYGKVALSGEPAYFENTTNALGMVFNVTAYRPAPGQFACIIDDVTSRKGMEQALQQERDRLNSILEISPVGIVICDHQGLIVYANEQAEKIMGLARDEITKLAYNAPDWRITDYFGNPFPDDKLSFSQIMATGRPVYNVRHSIKWPGGKQVYLDMSAAPLFDKSGTVNGMVATFEDIEEKQRAELMLEQSHHRYQQLVEHASDGIFTLNAEGFFSFVNEGICGMLGYTREEMFRLSILDTYPEATKEEGSHRLDQLKSGKTFGFERAMKRKDGSLITIEANCWRSEEGHFQAIVRDITERKKAEETQKKLQEQLIQAQKMESVGRLAGGVAHDFNNLLAAIMMNIGLAETLPNLDSQIKQMLKEIQGNAGRAANLTRQLLMFSRRSFMNMKKVNIGDIVDGMAKMLGRLIGENINLRVEHKAGLPIVIADEGMLEQVLMNLAVNARDAMPKGGHLTISLDAVEISKEQIGSNTDALPGRFVCLSVSDTGCGMDEDTRARIFEPFFTTKELGKGTGLGLATVYGIVAQHHGWVEVESEVDNGTAFHVFLPADPESALDTVIDEKQELLSGDETILLVEDDSSLRRIMSQGLQSLGYTVIQAKNGLEAIQKWHEFSDRIDMLFSDMVMPEKLTGIELAEIFQQQKPELKIVITSGYSPETVGEIRENIAFLQKPFRVETMAKTVRNCFNAKNTQP